MCLTKWPRMAATWRASCCKFDRGSNMLTANWRPSSAGLVPSRGHRIPGPAMWLPRGLQLTPDGRYATDGESWIDLKTETRCPKPKDAPTASKTDAVKPQSVSKLLSETEQEELANMFAAASLKDSPGKS